MFPEDMDSQTEDSSLHGGRIRSFKHERGNWATYVYLPCETDILYFPCFFSPTYLLLNYNWSCPRSVDPVPTECPVFLRLPLLRLRPSRGGVLGAVGGTALSGKGPWCGSEPTGRVSPESVADCGAETSLDPALHTEPQERPAALQEVCSNTVNTIVRMVTTPHAPNVMIFGNYTVLGLVEEIITVGSTSCCSEILWDNCMNYNFFV